MSSVPAIIITPAGPVAPEESAILAGVLADLNTAFGGGMNTDLRTPQGQWAQTCAAIIGGKNSEVLAMFNGFDPRYSTGRMQDALGYIYYLERDPARPTSVNVIITGLPGTVVPAGAKAQATDGRVYGQVGAVTIGGGGSSPAVYQCLENGPIPCPAGSLNKIYQAIPGWDTITNPTDGTPGNDVETPQAFEQRRRASVALNARAIVDSIQAAVLETPNVLDAYTIENPEGNSVIIGGKTLAANSIYVCVSGGADADIARAIWSKKPPGCNYVGDTAVAVADVDGGYDTPPIYTVRFERPDDLTIYFAVTIQGGDDVPSDYASQIDTAVYNAFYGLDGGTRARIGSTLYALRYYSAITALGSWARVVSIRIGTAPSPSGDSVSVGIDKRPVTSNAAITTAIV